MAKSAKKRGAKGAEDAHATDLRLREALGRTVRLHLDLPGVVGVGIGEKLTAGRPDGRTAVIFYVRRKLADRAEILAAGSNPLPATIELLGTEYPTDIVEERFLKADSSTAALDPVRVSRQDPVVAGLSVGNGGNPASGTIGAIVADRAGRGLRVLSNWHVLDGGTGVPAVNQPGLLDDSRAATTVLGSLVRGSNQDIDAAIASVEGRSVRREIFGLGVAVERVATPRKGDLVAMSGRTSGVIYGIVRLLNPVRVRIDHIPFGYWVEVFGIDPVASSQAVSQGDSGAAWMLCDANSQPTTTMVGINVALAAGAGSSLACFATKAFDAMRVDPATEDDVGDHHASHALDAKIAPAEMLPAPGQGVPHLVTASVLVIRRFPNETAEITGQRYYGDTVLVNGRSGNWAKVDLTGNGSADGWMDASHLDPIATPAATSAAPILAAPKALAAGDVTPALTPALVKAICPDSPMSGITASLPAIVAGLREFGLTDEAMVAMALGTVAAEVGVWFRPVDEGVYPGNTSVTPYDRYDGRADLGNDQPGDGARFHGRGFVQLTGRDNYQRVGDQLGVDLIGNPDSAKDPVLAGRILSRFLKNKETAMRVALATGKLLAARRLVNGGSNGFDTFQAVLKRAQTMLD